MVAKVNEGAFRSSGIATIRLRMMKGVKIRKQLEIYNRLVLLDLISITRRPSE